MKLPNQLANLDINSQIPSLEGVYPTIIGFQATYHAHEEIYEEWNQEIG